MGVIEYAQIFLTHLQFLALLNHLDIPWPSSWRSILSWLEIFNLDFHDLLVQHDFPQFDFRGMFLIIAVFVPIALTILVLVIFNPFYVILWYAGLVVGSIVLIVGLLGYYLPAAAGVAAERNVAMSYIILGAIITGAFILVALVSSVRKSTGGSGALSAVNLREEALACNVWRSLKHLAVAIGCLVAGGILSGIINVNVEGLNQQELSTQGNIMRVLSSVLLAFGVACAVYFLINLVEIGRKFTYNVGAFFHKHLLKLLLIVLSVTYIPILSYSINMFMCVEYSCPAGTKFNPFVQRPVGNTSTSSEIFCDRCDPKVFTQCPVTDVNVLCPAFSDRRLVKYPDISCTVESHPYFMVAAVLSVLVYLFAIPKLYRATVMICTNTIDQSTVIVAVPGEVFSEEELWKAKVYSSEAAPSSLYRSYKKESRFYSLVLLTHKTGVVLMLLIISPFRSDAAIVLTLILHSLASLMNFKSNPYLSRAEGVVASSLSVANVVNSAYGILVWLKGDNVPDYTTGIFIALNGVIPIVALTVVQLYVNQTSSSEVKERKQRIKDWTAQVKKTTAEARKERKAIQATQPPTINNEEGGPIITENPLDGKPLPPPAPLTSTSTTEPIATTPAAQPGDVEVSEPPKALPPATTTTTPTPGLVPTQEETIRILEEARAEMKRAEAVNAAVDVQINRDVSNLMTRYFMTMGLILFLALGFTVLGSLRTPIDEYINASNGETDFKKALGGMSSWSSFNTSCCCYSSTTKKIPFFNTTERWICLDIPTTKGKTPVLGKTVTRGRVRENGAKDSGIGVRGLCGARFVPQCAMRSSEAVVDCNPRPTGVSEYALRTLW